MDFIFNKGSINIEVIDKDFVYNSDDSNLKNSHILVQLEVDNKNEVVDDSKVYYNIFEAGIDQLHNKLHNVV